MAVTLISSPGSIAFARNPCVVQLRADADGAGTLYDALGVYSTLTATLPDRFATGETLTIDYDEPDGTSESVVFTAAATYDDDDQIPDNSFAGTNTAYWAAVVSKLGGHPRIAPFFSVASSGSIVVTIRARNVEAGWDIALSTTSALAVADFGATASTLPANYKVLLEVFAEDTYRGGDYDLKAQLQGTPEAGTGFVYFDISTVLAAHCRSSREEPLVNQWNPADQFLADNLRRYYFRFTEESGEPPVADDWTYGDVSTAMDGGVSQSVFAEGDFLGAMDASDALLSWMPDGRRVGMNQPILLAWYNHTGSTQSTRIHMQAYDITDDSVIVDIYVYGPLSVRSEEVSLHPFQAVLYALDEEPNVYKCRIRVEDFSTNALSQWRTFYLDREYYESERYIQYLNGFGVPECWRCTGEWTKKLKVERQTALKPLAPGYNALASDRYQYGRLWDNELVYRTGFLTQGEAEVLQEMLIAGEVYDVSEEGYIPLQITSRDFLVVETRQNLRAYEFTAQPRLDMKNYSKKKLTELLAGAWLEPGGQAWFDAFLVAWEEP